VVTKVFYTFALIKEFISMKPSEQTLQQLDRAIRKIADKFPPADEYSQMTDIHIRVTQETGEVTAFNDDDEEIARFVIEQWIGNTDDDFYDQIASIIRRSIEANKENVEMMSILKPFSFVLEDEDKESLEELYLVDDEVVMINPELMAGLDEDLNDFMEKLLKD
jgi:hypothetical protein